MAKEIKCIKVVHAEALNAEMLRQSTNRLSASTCRKVETTWTIYRSN